MQEYQNTATVKHLLLILACTFLFASVRAQSGWTQAPGEGYFKLAQNGIRAGAFYNPIGEVVDITTTSVYTTLAYGELGLTPRLTALANAPLFVRSTLNRRESRVDGHVIPGDESNGLGDIQLGLKYGLITKGPIVLAVSGVAKLPTGSPVGGSSELLQTGDGAWGFLSMVHASHSFYPSPFYASVSAGYNWRGTATLDYSTGSQTVDYDDGMRWGAELGWTPGDHWQVGIKLDHLMAIETSNGNGVTGSSSVFGNRVSYLALTPEVNYRLASGLGFSAAAAGVVYARNILAAPGFTLGAFYVLSRNKQ